MMVASEKDSTAKRRGARTTGTPTGFGGARLARALKKRSIDLGQQSSKIPSGPSDEGGAGQPKNETETGEKASINRSSIMLDPPSVCAFLLPGLQAFELAHLSAPPTTVVSAH